MQQFIADFHFLRPEWLWLLLLPLLLYRLYFKGLQNVSSWEGVCDPNLLDYLLIRGSSTLRRSLAIIALSGFIAAVIAAAGPSWKKKEMPDLLPENPLMILLNMSSDMEEKDPAPSRLERAKYKIIDLLKQSSGMQAGLIVYSSEPFMITPVTEDAQILANLMPAVNRDIMPANGDRLDRAIDLAAESLRNAGFSRGSIIVLAAEAGQNFDEALKAAARARSENFRVDVLAVTSQPSEKLEMIAARGGGVYAPFSAGDADVNKIAAAAETRGGDLKQGANKQSVWEDYGYYLTIIPLLCCLYFFRRGILTVILLLGISANAEAGFFLNDNQEGLRAFNQGDFAAAAGKFSDPQWKASSFYRQGDYQKALQNFSQGQDVTALYNQGNALAKSGKIAEAIAKYEEVLKTDPNHEDAAFNLEYLKQQQQEQQQNQQQDENQEQDRQDQEQNQQPQNSDGSREQNRPQDNSDDDRQTDEQNQPQNADDADGQNKEESSPQQQNDRRQDLQEMNEQPDAKPEDEKKGGNALQKSEEDNKYDEEVQAREQQYREIPEDPGGLLRAFIRKEYMKNRYKE